MRGHACFSRSCSFCACSMLSSRSRTAAARVRARPQPFSLRSTCTRGTADISHGLHAAKPPARAALVPSAQAAGHGRDQRRNKGTHWQAVSRVRTEGWPSAPFIFCVPRKKG